MSSMKESQTAIEGGHSHLPSFQRKRSPDDAHFKAILKREKGKLFQ